MSAPQEDQRKFQRFRSTAFLGTPLVLRSVPPLSGEPIEGQVVDLSGGGMAILIRVELPLQTQMRMELMFPDQSVLTCMVIIRRTSGCTGGFLTGIEFLDMPADMVGQIDQMARDCNACDARIAAEEKNVCDKNCSFMGICDKTQKLSEEAPARPIEMKLKQARPAA